MMTPRDWIRVVVMAIVLIAAAVFLIWIAANGAMLPPTPP